MGLSSSKGHRKVTKVTPVACKEGKLTTQGSVAVYNFQSPLRQMSPNIFASPTGRNPVMEGQLPPLREARHGRYPTVPQTAACDLSTEGREASIIKQHPPRRLQLSSVLRSRFFNSGINNHKSYLHPYLVRKLEPFILAKDVPPDKYSSLQSGSATCKAKKELERGRQAAIHPNGRRQYLLQMKMLEIRKEEELRRRLREEARLRKLQTRDLDMRRAVGHMQGNNSSEDEDLLAQDLHKTFKRNQGDRWDGELFKEPGPSDAHLSQRGKVEAWLLKQQARRDSSSDASSSDSDNWKYPCRRPALVRTKTERITLFDEFFDKEF
ncbi:uncharacterized protein CCDC198 isoform X1 [Sceloporus undulatus]|uniref:uncharacterized protein CCDC198 isoform X1 n=1 Tax=Sceloporus undulatus TaxID=8520 RepID=UPI001C4B33CD|nr:uncharacterized protein CCDC198 isoform X1 [Sceloporus undulatus]